ncbi:hypothetical protein [Nocardia crassostreae]|uniref:hypothetical protein n=1 Tax=Nocardia crassostreae TaxID=53428 RepID=UPI000830BDCE|nr:hypothetical protein [Nocardia crassostreae]
MDLYNNNLGREIATRPGVTAENLKSEVQAAVNQGQAIVIGTKGDGGDPQIGWSGGQNGIPEVDTGLPPGTYVPLPTQ